MEKELLHILQHSLGLDQYGQGNQYRNHFVAGGDDVRKCRELAALGYMRERQASELSGGSPWFNVTANGMAAVKAESQKPPPEPKLTRGQRRYRDYLKDADCFESFGHWLKYRAHQARHGA